MRRPLTAIGVVAVTGAVLTVLVALAVHDSTDHVMEVVLTSAGIASITGALGAGVGWLLRRRSLGVQVALVALTAVAAVALGAWAAARAMYVNAGDLATLAVILAASATGAAVTAMIVAERLRQESSSLVALTGRIAAADPGAGEEALPDTAELETVGRALVEAAGRLEQSRAREARLEASRRELVAWLSHDLRTPLSSIRAMTEAIEDGVASDPGTVQRYHRRIREEVDHLTQLVDDLMALNRANVAPAPTPRDVVALRDLVSDTLASLRPIADAAGVSLTGGVSDQDPTVRIVTRDIGRALRNVLDNAVRHTPEGGEVNVTTSSDGSLARVQVRDGCGGIPADDLGRVFEVGFTGRPARTRGDADGPEAGTGLGLAVTKGLVEAHGGRVSVANVDGGCRFTVELPVDDPEMGP